MLANSQKGSNNPADLPRQDFECVGGPPDLDLRLPGYRYGASSGIRPVVVLQPCPCAGGQWNAPTSDNMASLGVDGLWSFPKGWDEMAKKAAKNLEKAQGGAKETAGA